MWLSIGMLATLGFVLAFGGMVLAMRRRNLDVCILAFGTLVLIHALACATVYQNRLTADRISALEAQLAKQPATKNTTAEQK